MNAAIQTKARRHLRAVDPIIAGVIESVGPARFAPRNTGTHFDAVLSSIVSQQLSLRAAATIHGRVRALLDEAAPVPAQILSIPDESLRAAGLSTGKTKYVKSLAEHVMSGALPIEDLHVLPDAEIIEKLTEVKGIGRWTAQMFLIFRLGRPDVLPDLDLGIQKGMQRAYHMRKLPSPDRVMKVGAKWKPYRSLAAWYLWRLLEVAE